MSTKKSAVLPLLVAVMLAACGGGGKEFRLTGRLLNINQGEFYVYSAEGDVEGMDTITVMAGRFEYAKELPRATTLMIVFPNFTEQPIFALPNGTAKIDGDASHLKDMKVKGSPDDKLMNTVRPRLADATEREKAEITEQFVREHPESRVGLYLVRRCLLMVENPDFAKSAALIDTMLAAQPKNGALMRMRTELKGRRYVEKDKGIPAFKATDTEGRKVSEKELRDAEVGVVIACATWNRESMEALRRLNKIKKKAKDRLHFVAISVDMSEKAFKKRVETDTITSPMICDGRGIDGSLFRLLGLRQADECLIFEKGKLKERVTNPHDLKKKVATKLGLDPASF